MNLKKLVRPNVQKLRPYQAEEIPCRVKLDANESPYGMRLLRSVETNRYPDPEAKAMRSLFARSVRVRMDNVLHGNGSDELIFNMVTTFRGPVLYPEPTFSMYGIISQSLGEKHRGVPLDEEFDLDMDRMMEAIRRLRPGIVFLSSPNNPTGNSFSEDRIIHIINNTPGIVVVDEAYQQFSDRSSFIPKLKKYRNLVVLRTLSKIGLAALRVGFMVADPALINEVNKVRLPFNVNALSQAAAVKALEERRRVISFIKDIKSERRRLMKEMKGVNGITVFRSDANFILFRADDGPFLYKRLMSQGVLIRDMNPVLKNCLRVTVGSPRENDIFLKTLNKLL